MANTVKLKVFADIVEQAVAAGAITPGMLVERTSANLVQAHSTPSGAAQKMFAVEDSMQGRGLTDDYAATEPVQLWLPQAGEVVQGIADPTTGTVIAIGDKLVSAGDGTLKVYVAPASSSDVLAADCIIGVALEAADAGETFAVEII